MTKIKVSLLASSSIGMNQSGMKTQLDTIESFFKNDLELEVKKYDFWDYQKPDVVHFFGLSEGMKDHLTILKSQGVKLICSPNHWPINNGIVEKFLLNFNIKNIIFSNRATKKYLLDNSDFLIVNSEAEKKKFQNFYNIKSEKIKIIYNSYGQEPIPKTDAFLKKYKIGKPYCLLVGMIGAERKNQLRILKNWKDDYPNLYLLGKVLKNNYSEKCLEIINRSKNIHYLGFESDFEVLESAYQNTKLVISPGIIETPSLVALRALINGANVCSTNGGQVTQEYFNDNAYYFNPLDEVDIINSIKYALNSPKEVNIEEIKNFSNQNIMKNYKELYEKLF